MYDVCRHTWSPSALSLCNHSHSKNNPPFAEAILAPSISTFARTVFRQQQARHFEERERARRFAALQANPFDIEAQRAIEV